MAGILLGPILFVDREVPDTVAGFGGAQRATTHKLMGGARVIDAMGPDPDPIKWSGKFLGPSASQRCRAVDQLKNSGQQVPLSWGSFSYLVLVTHFQPVYKHEWEIGYAIECTVVSVGLGVASLPTVDQAVGSDIASIGAIAAAAPASPAVAGDVSLPASTTGAVASLQGTLANAAGQGSLDDLSIAAAQSVLDAAEQTYQTVAGDAVQPAGMNFDAIIGGSTLDGFGAFAGEAALVAQESDEQTALGYLGRIVANIATLGG